MSDQNENTDAQAGTDAGGPGKKLEADRNLDAAMREAVAAVEEVERRRAGEGKAVKAEGRKSSQPEAAEGDAAEGESADDTAEEELERLRKEVTSLKDISMRTLADFDNYRKRIDREREEQKRYALIEPLRAFLPVIDNLERALEAGGSFEDLKQGVQMIHRQMVEMLERFHVAQVPAQGERFDPRVHEAVLREEDDVEHPTVKQEMQKGYTLHERLLRPALVTVAMPRSTPQVTTDGES